MALINGRSQPLIDTIYLHEGKREGKLSIGHIIDDDTDRYKNRIVFIHILLVNPVLCDLADCLR